MSRNFIGMMHELLTRNISSRNLSNLVVEGGKDAPIVGATLKAADSKTLEAKRNRLRESKYYSPEYKNSEDDRKVRKYQKAVDAVYKLDMELARRKNEGRLK